ncbi:MAG: branched-chain amino acid transport system II carrier protein [Desulfovibrio fairfieldensis]
MGKIPRAKLSFRALLLVSATIFSLHFGAASMLWPTTWGRDSGLSYPVAFMGFFLSGIFLPWLGYLAVSKGKATFYGLTRNVGRKFCLIYGGITVLALGPLFAVPRMSAASWDAVSRLFSIEAGGRAFLLSILFMLAFYLVTLWFFYQKGAIVNRVGKILVPVFLLMEIIIIAVSIYMPVGEAAGKNYALHPLGYGFINGYQTMDLICAIMFSGFIIYDLQMRLGKDTRSVNRALAVAGLLGFLIRACAQFGEMYRCSTASSVFPDLSYAKLSATLALVQLGVAGGIVFNFCLFMACLSTAIGLLAGTASFIEEASGGKISYKTASLLCFLTAFIVSCAGFEAIFTWATPILQFIYPPCIALALCHAFLSRFTGGLRAACYAAALWGLADAAAEYLKLFGVQDPGLLLALVPGYEYGLAFIWLTVAGWLCGQTLEYLHARAHENVPAI